MERFNRNQSIGEIVSMLPKASEVFKQYRIDFCCGGNRPLSEAIKEQNLNEKEILAELDKIFKESNSMKSNITDFRTMSPIDLIEYIVNTHYDYVKKVLPELGELTTKIMRVHGVKHEELFKVHKLFSTLKTELEQHLPKEEEVLFPLIKEYDRNPSDGLLNRINKVLKETENEHEAAGDIIKELRKITAEYTVPNDGCNTYFITFDKLQELEADLFQHIHLENNILFKKLGIKAKSYH